MSNQVQVIDNISNTILFATSLAKIAEAYSFATLMEEEGLDIRIEAAGLPETLIHSLGADKLELAEYKKSLDQEISFHKNDHEVNLGCTVCFSVLDESSNL
jgi:hypothetical protein